MQRSFTIEEIQKICLKTQLRLGCTMSVTDRGGVVSDQSKQVARSQVDRSDAVRMMVQIDGHQLLQPDHHHHHHHHYQEHHRHGEKSIGVYVLKCGENRSPSGSNLPKAAEYGVWGGDSLPQDFFVHFLLGNGAFWCVLCIVCSFVRPQNLKT